MTAAVLARNPDVDFLYYSNDMIGAGGLLYCRDQGIDVPGRVGLAGFNGLELLDGLPRRLATMDACRLEAGRRAAQIIAGRNAGPEPRAGGGGTVPDPAARRHDPAAVSDVNRPE